MKLATQDFERAAQRLHCPLAAVRAVCEVEAPRGGFNPDGSVVTLFEGHWFYKLTKGAYRRERVKNVDIEPAMKYRRVGTINNTAFQTARTEAGLPQVRVHDFRHTFAQRLRDAGVPEEDRALLLGHAVAGMAQHYATSTVERLIEVANKVSETRDRTTILRVVNG